MKKQLTKKDIKKLRQNKEALENNTELIKK